MSTPTVESIRKAHALETHPAQTPVDWSDSDLYRDGWPDDIVIADRTLIIRVTYADDSGHAPNLRAGDYAYAADACDSVIRDAQSISRHDGVYTVALYRGDISGILVSDSPDPMAVFSDGIGVEL